MKWQQNTRLSKLKPAVPAAPGKPRNPHVAASRFRKAGAHGPGKGSVRADAMREVRNLVKDLLKQGP
jgi:hypothetical protein